MDCFSVIISLMVIDSISGLDHHLNPFELTQLVCSERKLLKFWQNEFVPNLNYEKSLIKAHYNHLIMRAKEVEEDFDKSKKILKIDENNICEMSENYDVWHELSLVDALNLFQHWIDANKTIVEMVEAVNNNNDNKNNDNKDNKNKRNNDNNNNEKKKEIKDLLKIPSLLPSEEDLKLLYTHLVRVQHVYSEFDVEIDELSKNLSKYQCFELLRVSFEMLREDQFETWSNECLRKVEYKVEHEARSDEITDMRNRLKEELGKSPSKPSNSSHLLSIYKQLCSVNETTSLMPSLEKCSWSNIRILDPLKLEFLSYDPKIYIVHEIIHNQLIEEIISKSVLEKPKVFSSASGEVSNEDLSGVRVGKVGFVDTHSNNNVHFDRIFENIADLDTTQGDPLQVVAYGPGGHYEPHVDYFDVYSKSDKFSFRLMSDRMTTLLMSLNDVTKGGNTIFPYLGLSVKPTKGNVLVFSNLYEDGRGDEFSLHAGCPLVKGHKWIANFWVNQRGNELRSKCGLNSS